MLWDAAVCRCGTPRVPLWDAASRMLLVLLIPGLEKMCKFVLQSRSYTCVRRIREVVQLCGAFELYRHAANSRCDCPSIRALLIRQGLDARARLDRGDRQGIASCGQRHLPTVDMDAGAGLEAASISAQARACMAGALVISPDFSLELTGFFQGKRLIHFLVLKMKDFRNFVLDNWILDFDAEPVY